MWLLNGSYILTKILEDISFLFYYFHVSLFSSLYPFVSSVPCNVSPSRSRRFFSHPLSPLATFSPDSSHSIRAPLISVSVTGLSLCFAKLAGKVNRENSTETKAVKKGIRYYFFFRFFVSRIHPRLQLFRLVSKSLNLRPPSLCRNLFLGFEKNDPVASSRFLRGRQDKSDAARVRPQLVCTRTFFALFPSLPPPPPQISWKTWLH